MISVLGDDGGGLPVLRVEKKNFHRSGGAPTASSVSCVVICFNQSRWVREALDSVANQKYPNHEFIVIDDASTDGSQAIIADWIRTCTLDVRFIQHEENRGIVSTLNEALALVAGEYVALLAADDAWLPGKLQREVAILDEHSKDVALVYSHSALMSASGKRLGDVYIERSGHDWITIESPPQGDIFEDLLYQGNFIQLQAALLRRDALQEVGPGDGDLAYEDYELLLKLASRYRIVFSETPGVLYRLSGSSSAIRRLYPRILENQYDVRVKYLRRNGHLDRRLAAILAFEARLMYKDRTPNHIRYMRDALRHEPSKQMRWLAAAARLRVPWSMSQFLLNCGIALLHPGEFGRMIGRHSASSSASPLAGEGH